MSKKTNKSRIDSILDAVDASIITIDKKGIIVSCNDATTRMFGYSREELLDKNVKILMPSPNKEEHDGYLKNHLTTGVNRIIGVGRQVSGRHQSGRIFPLHLSVAKYEDNGLFFTGILHDLTELEEARSASQRLGQIVDESVNEIYTFDVNTLKFSTVNKAAIDNLGLTLEELKGLTPVDLFFGLSKEDLLTILGPLVEGDSERVSFATNFVRNDKSQYQAEVTVHLSHAFGTPEFAAIVQDVTDKNRMLESIRRSQKIESLGNLTGGIAHDFNNILTVIIGNLDLLDIQRHDPEEIELLEEVKGAAAMGARLTNRLLAFAGRSSLSPARSNVNTLIKDLTEMLSRTLGDNISLETNLVENLWITKIDVSELENALVNLCINSRDAMDNGGRLIIETANCELDDETILGKGLKAGEYVRIMVTDTGTGIPEELRDTLFEPFVTSKKGGKGTGLGLSMVYGFVRQSGGAISVYTEPGIGTAFSMYLPREHLAEERDRPSEPIKEERPSDGKVILIAEDDDNVRRLTKRRLEALGHHVVPAVDGHEALVLFKENKNIEIVFTDVVMTEGMSGYDLALAIQEISPDMPILLTSGFALNIISDEQLEASGLPLLRKPYHQSDLRAALDGLLSES